MASGLQKKLCISLILTHSIALCWKPTTLNFFRSLHNGPTFWIWCTDILFLHLNILFVLCLDSSLSSYVFLQSFFDIFNPAHLCVSHLLMPRPALLPAPDLQQALRGLHHLLHRAALALQQAGCQQEGSPHQVTWPPKHCRWYHRDHSGCLKIRVHSGCVTDILTSER